MTRTNHVLAVLDEAIALSRSSSLGICESLEKLGCNPTQILRDTLGIDSVSEGEIAPDTEALNALPMDVIVRAKALPLSIDAHGRLSVAMTDPTDIDRIAELQAIAGVPIVPLACTNARMDQLLALTRRKMGQSTGGSGLGSAASPIARLVDSIVLGAIRDGASDIHFEPFERELVVRVRKDGILHVVRRLSYRVASEVVSRLKIMASMDIAERRRPQDGGIRFATESRVWDIRVSALPTENGQKMVLRILDRGSVTLDMASLGMFPAHQKLVEKYLDRPHGMILVTGPTGSGKTTTLYTLLHRLRSPEINICTVEDPVEYRLEGITQTAVNAKIGLNFSAALRTLLRQDPDVILVGEIRDSETAELAVRAALTGHLVLSTLHTNDAATAVARLVDMGVEPFLLASCLQLVVAQRLVRRLCPECHGENSTGCANCSGSGFQGRIGIYEMMPVDEAISEAIQKRESVSAIRGLARKAGWLDISADGKEKVEAKLTTMAEVMREALT